MQWNYYAAFKKREDPLLHARNMDEHQGHYAKWNKPITKTNALWLHSYEICKVVKIIETQTRQMAATIWKKREELLALWARFSFARQKLNSVAINVITPNTTELYTYE